MISQLLFLAIIPFFTSALPFKDNEINSDKFFRLDAVKLRGSSIDNAETGNKPQILVKRDGSDYISMGLQSENTFYLANIKIGSNDQEVGVLVDTGSSDLWVVNSNNTYCEPSTVTNKGRALEDFAKLFINEKNDEDFNLNNNMQDKSSSSLLNCSQYGTFNPNSSDSFVSNYTSFSITYADKTFAKGTWSQDTVTIGDLNIENMNLAVCGDTDNSMGVLGIGFASLEVTASSSYTKNLYTYENLPLKLVSDGIINKAAYSVYLNNNDSSAEILFGAIDQNKYTGDLVELPIVSVLNNYGYGKPIQIVVTLNSIVYVDKTKNEEATLVTGAGAVLLDTGSTISYMPSDILDSIVNQLGLQYSDSLGYYLIDCNSGDDYSFKFNFQGLDIEVPLSSFFINLVGSDGSTSSQCAFGIVSTTYPYSTFGDSFLTNVYMVVDLEDYKVALAQGADASGDSNLSIIDTKIPEAKQPINSVTYGGSVTVLSTISNPTMTSISSSSLSSHLSSYITSHSSSFITSHSSSTITSHSSSSISRSSFSSSSLSSVHSKVTPDTSSLSSSSSDPGSSSAASFAPSSSPKKSSSSSSNLGYSSIHSSSPSLYSSSKATSSSFGLSLSSSTLHFSNKVASSKTQSKSLNSSEFTTFSSKISSTTSLTLSTSSSLSSSTGETSTSVSSISSTSHKNAANRQVIGYTGIFAYLIALL